MSRLKSSTIYYFVFICLALISAALCLATPIIFYSKVIGVYYLEKGKKVVKGEDGWLFLRSEFACLFIPGPKANIDRIVSFSEALQRKGVLLIVVPVPV